MSSSPLAVLYVDPDPDERAAVTGTLQEADGIESLGVDGFGSATTALQEWDVDCLVSEHELGDGTALDLFQWARESSPDTACSLYTGTDLTDIGTDEFSDVVAEYLSRTEPDAGTRLVDLVHNVVANRTQVGYPVPDTEDDRLAAVREYDLPDLSTIETFDRLTHLVADHFGIAVAFIGLIKEDHEEFLACHGADWETLTREDSICTYSMLEQDVTVIADVQSDPRFADNETLKELNIRSYAGANLTTPGGEVIGELCLVDDEPRGYTDEELASLRLFADEAMEQLELRYRLANVGS